MNKALQEPELMDSLYNLKDDIFRVLNCVKVGRIQSFNVSTKTAEIQILFKRVMPDQTIKSYPVLVDCPVFTLQGGGSYLEMPIAAGDQCIILFSDRNIDAWYKNGAEAAPFTDRCHDMSDGIALVGINALTSTLANYATDEVKLVYGNAKIGEKGGKITIRNNSTSLLTVIDGLIDVIKGLTAGGAPIDAPGLSALEAYKTTVASLLY